MRVPLSWLAELVPFDLDPEALADRLTLLGMEVSGIARIGSDWRDVVVGELTEVAPHPGSERLSLTRVRVDEQGEPLSIVCGATNIAPGQRVPVALPGAVLPGGRRIEVTTIAGAASQGMLCSGDELGLTSDADGILILPGDAAIGLALSELAGEVVLDVDVKPNRGDALSILGLAREVAAATGAPLQVPGVRSAAGAVDEEVAATEGDRWGLRVDVDEPGLCTRFVGHVIEGVTVGPSPWHVQRRLIAAGMRPLSNVVDASNHVMLELGKPVHTFDAAAVHERHIVVRLARPGERLETLDHIERELSPEDLVIGDPRRALAIAGVMGGASSEVSATTRDVIVESAIFDPVSIRRTAFRHALRSEASLRFEKGQEHGLALSGARRTAELILRWAGGRAAPGLVDTDPVAPPPVRIPFRPWRVGRLLGEAIAVEEQRALLARVGVETGPATGGQRVPVIVEGRSGPGPDAADLMVPLTSAEADGALVATVPAHRADLRIEADLAEEVARVRGYETLAGRLPDSASPPFRPDPRRLQDAIRELLLGAGLTEVVSHGLISPEDHARLGFGADDAATIRAANPVTVEHSELRRALLPGHLRVLVENERRRRPDVHLFEIGPVHAWDAGAPREDDRLGLLLAGDERPVAPDRPRQSVDTAHAKGLLESLALRLLGCRLRYQPGRGWAGVEHPGRTAEVVAVTPGGRETVLGRVGEVHPRLLRACDVRAERVVFADLSLDAMRRVARAERRVGALPQGPGVERDIAVLVPLERPAGEVEAVIREQGGESLAGLRLFDVYRGAPLAAGEKSLAYRLSFESAGEPLDERTVDAAMAGIVAGLRARLNARLRA